LADRRKNGVTRRREGAKLIKYIRADKYAASPDLFFFAFFAASREHDFDK
jgi:hypothetical protein